METQKFAGTDEAPVKKERKKKRCDRGGECYNNLNQKAKLRGPAPHLSSTVTVWALISVHLASDSGSAPLREAPGSDFSCFVKRIMTQMFAQVCSQSQKYQDSSGIYAMCSWGALIDRTMPIGWLPETSFNNIRWALTICHGRL